MLYHEDNLNSEHTLVDILDMDRLGILVGMYKFHCCTVYWIHKVMGYMDRLALVLVVAEGLGYTW